MKHRSERIQRGVSVRGHRLEIISTQIMREQSTAAESRHPENVLPRIILRDERPAESLAKSLACVISRNREAQTKPQNSLRAEGLPRLDDHRGVQAIRKLLV